ncbi:hypothetical protein NLJ89_g4158 [Agrocybe chaxingu]|uniref:Uncharacterized protein n=1 Tax=Agrocybe chaxingu TaxID=84603 RepID=A0A9W8K124_9AGAR|nr:hypothetical protein NLJ89_g4158 [Agrocybe chaxingu]
MSAADVDVVSNKNESPYPPPKREHKLTFPPFPPVPEGVQMVPFKDFKAEGIRVDPGPDDEEVDTYGIPTVTMPVKHTNDECKTNTKRKRAVEAKKARKKGLVASRVWWEQWEDAEKLKFVTGLNPAASRFERIQAACVEFTKDHIWPITFASETGPKFIWEKFQRYIGIPESDILGQEKSKKAKKKAARRDNEMSDVDDGDNEDTPPIADGAFTSSMQTDTFTPKKKIVSNEEKLTTFLDDPEKSIRIFLSSYAQAKGADANLDCLPRVIRFFVEYLLRSKVLPDCEQSLRRSLDSINAGLIEIPNCSTIAKVMPDKFSLGCQTFWGRKADGYSVVETGLPTEWDLVSSRIEEVEPQTKKQKTESENKPKTSLTWAPSWGQAGDAPWAASAEGLDGWGQPIDTSIVEEAASDVVDDSAWDMATYPLIGPANLSSTHAPGVVERSMRVIKSIIHVGPPPPAPPPGASAEPDVAAVEAELEHKFVRVLLGPMIDWDGGESPALRRPTILKTSNGLVIEEGVEPPAVLEGGAKPHDPLNSDITLLIENIPEQVQLLREGMGIGGTWVQLARKVEPPKKKKGKSKSKKASYWYLDEFTFITPSFWTIANEEDA